jgi:membrane protein
MAFDLFLALVPLLALLGWVLSYVLRADDRMRQYLSLWLNVTPQEVSRLVIHHEERFNGKAIAPLAILGCLWLSSGAFDTVMAAFDRTTPGGARPWWQRRAVALLCVLVLTSGLALGAWLALKLSGGPEWLFEWVPSAARRGDTQSNINLSRTVGASVGFATFVLMVAGFFRIGVRRTGKQRVVWPGTLFTITLFALASSGLAVYVRTLASYAFYYGSLAAVAVLLVWLWLCSFALLLGAEINTHLEQNPGIIRESLRPLLKRRWF